jgi:Ca2+-binding RTX toxin-like protein
VNELLNAPIHTNVEVSAEMFGGNNLFLHNHLSGESASFPVAADLLGVTGLRFPGGAMTEYFFDIDNPDGPPLNKSESEVFVGITEFLDYAASTGRPPTIVLPTFRMYDGDANAASGEPRSINQQYLEKVIDFVRAVVSHGGTWALPDVPIAAFEIGNEYWGSGEMTAKEYGQLVNDIIPKIAAIFDEFLGEDVPHPKILIQMGGPWDSQYANGIYSDLTWSQRISQCNLDIIEQIVDPLAKAQISGLIEHYYYNGSDDLLGQGSASNSYIDLDLDVWNRAGFGQLDLAITEWGVNQHNSPQFGLRGASVIIEQMEHMLRMGADSAFAWPIQGWNTALAGPINSDPQLTPMGAAFLLMAESIVNTELLSIDMSGGSLEVNAYSSDEKVVLFVMSRSDGNQLVDFDISSLIDSYFSVEGVKIGIDPSFGVADPDATAVLTSYTGTDIATGSTLNFLLSPYEVMRIEFQLPIGGSFLGSMAPDHFVGGVGNDTILGRMGNDSLIGGRGDDIVVGSGGRDFLNGWGGDDSLSGGGQTDFIYAQDGNDRIQGGGGGDQLWADAGEDSVYGGCGRDVIDGGQGADYLIGGGGSDTLTGGSESDTFVFKGRLHSVANLDLISDMQTGVDRIALEQSAFVNISLGRLTLESFSENSSGLADSTLTRVVYEVDSGVLWYDRDGVGSEFDRVAFAILEPFLDLSASDFFVF